MNAGLELGFIRLSRYHSGAAPQLAWPPSLDTFAYIVNYLYKFVNKKMHRFPLTCRTEGDLLASGVPP